MTMTTYILIISFNYGHSSQQIEYTRQRDCEAISTNVSKQKHVTSAFCVEKKK